MNLLFKLLTIIIIRAHSPPAAATAAVASVFASTPLQTAPSAAFNVGKPSAANSRWSKVMDNLLVGEHPAHGLSEGPSTIRVQSDGGGHHNPSWEIDEIDDDRTADRAMGTNTTHVSSPNITYLSCNQIVNARCLCVFWQTISDISRLPRLPGDGAQAADNQCHDQAPQPPQPTSDDQHSQDPKESPLGNDNTTGTYSNDLLVSP